MTGNKEMQDLSFEEALQELEGIVRQLEQNDVPLEKALDQYQRGVDLSRTCREKLQKAEQTIIKVVDESGQERPFSMENEGEGGV